MIPLIYVLTGTVLVALLALFLLCLFSGSDDNIDDDDHDRSIHYNDLPLP